MSTASCSGVFPAWGPEAEVSALTDSPPPRAEMVTRVAQGKAVSTDRPASAPACPGARCLRPLPPPGQRQRCQRSQTRRPWHTQPPRPFSTSSAGARGVINPKPCLIRHPTKPFLEPKHLETSFTRALESKQERRCEIASATRDSKSGLCYPRKGYRIEVQNSGIRPKVLDAVSRSRVLG